MYSPSPHKSQKRWPCGRPAPCNRWKGAGLESNQGSRFLAGSNQFVSLCRWMRGWSCKQSRTSHKSCFSCSTTELQQREGTELLEGFEPSTTTLSGFVSLCRWVRELFSLCASISPTRKRGTL